jgi:hypothetical protein
MYTKQAELKAGLIVLIALGEHKASIIRQTAIFDPHGLWGQLYWYLIYPLHALVFRGMIRGVARAVQPGEGVVLS